MHPKRNFLMLYGNMKRKKIEKTRKKTQSRFISIGSYLLEEKSMQLDLMGEILEHRIRCSSVSL